MALFGLPLPDFRQTHTSPATGPHNHRCLIVAVEYPGRGNKLFLDIAVIALSAPEPLESRELPRRVAQRGEPSPHALSHGSALLATANDLHSTEQTPATPNRVGHLLCRTPNYRRPFALPSIR